MGILQKKRRTTGKKALAYRGKGGQNTDTAFLALRLGVVLYLLNKRLGSSMFRNDLLEKSLMKASSGSENCKGQTTRVPIEKRCQT